MFVTRVQGNAVGFHLPRSACSRGQGICLLWKTSFKADSNISETEPWARWNKILLPGGVPEEILFNKVLQKHKASGRVSDETNSVERGC